MNTSVVTFIYYITLANSVQLKTTVTSVTVCIACVPGHSGVYTRVDYGQGANSSRSPRHKF